MSQQYRQEHESLSALMDSEADDLELRRILKATTSDAELLATWERYHLVQSLLHDAVQPVSPELSKRIAAQIQAEPAFNQATTPAKTQSQSSWQQNLSKIAIAASVAVIFIVAVQTNTAPDVMPGLAQQDHSATASPQSQDVNLLAAETTQTPVVLDPEAQQRLQDYIARMSFDEKEPLRTEHIQDSPLFRLVNELGQ